MLKALLSGAAVTVAGCSGNQGGESTETDASDGNSGIEQPTDADVSDGTDMAGTTVSTDTGEFAITFTQGAGAVTLDPHNHSTPETYDAHAAVYEQLLFVDGGGDIQPMLASDWERLDPLRVKFTIREGVTFHNGDELTPEDVRYSVKRVADDDFGIVSPQSTSYRNITGFEINEDENSIILETEAPDVLLVRKLANGLPIVSKNFVESNSEQELATTANGTGPFTVTEFEEDNIFVAERFDDYWGWPWLTEQGFPQVTEFTMEAVPESSTRASRALAGESDITNRIAAADYDRLGDLLELYQTDRYEYMKMKAGVEPFDSVEVRKAFNYAVDLETLNETFFDGQALLAGQPIPPFWVGHNEEIEPYPFDLDQAQELMSQSPYASDEIELELHTAVGALASDLDITQAVAGMLEEIPNVQVDVVERDFASLFSTLRGPIDGKPDFYRSSTGGSPGEAIAGKLERMFHAEGSGTLWEDEETTQLIDEAKEATTIEERAEISKEAAQVIHDKAPDIFLWWRPSAIALSDRVAYEPFTDESFYMQLVEDARGDN